jgi:hypothetical protein
MVLGCFAAGQPGAPIRRLDRGTPFFHPSCRDATVSTARAAIACGRCAGVPAGSQPAGRPGRRRGSAGRGADTAAACRRHHCARAEHRPGRCRPPRRHRRAARHRPAVRGAPEPFAARVDAARDAARPTANRPSARRVASEATCRRQSAHTPRISWVQRAPGSAAHPSGRCHPRDLDATERRRGVDRRAGADRRVAGPGRVASRLRTWCSWTAVSGRPAGRPAGRRAARPGWPAARAAGRRAAGSDPVRCGRRAWPNGTVVTSPPTRRSVRSSAHRRHDPVDGPAAHDRTRPRRSCRARSRRPAVGPGRRPKCAASAPVGWPRGADDQPAFQRDPLRSHQDEPGRPPADDSVPNARSPRRPGPPRR